MNDSQILLFDGTPEYWTIWSGKCIIRSYLNGYGDHLEQDFKFNTKEGQLEEAQTKRHHREFCELLWAMKTPQDIMLVRQSNTTLSPRGCLTMAWTQRKAKYEPTDAMTKMELMKNFGNLKLEDYSTPDNWINEMVILQEILKNTFNKHYDEEDMLTSMFKNVPDNKAYSSLKLNFIKQMTSKIDTLDLDSFRLQLRMFQKEIITPKTLKQPCIPHNINRKFQCQVKYPSVSPKICNYQKQDSPTVENWVMKTPTVLCLKMPKLWHSGTLR